MDEFRKLLSHYNSENSDNTYYRIIDYILHNLSKITDLSITELAENTFTSAATITRFIHYLGYDNYTSFRKEFQNFKYTNLKSFLKLTTPDIDNLKDNPQLFMDNYTLEVCNSIADVSSTLNVKQIDDFLLRLHSTKNVSFFGYGDSLTIAKDIQLGLLTRKKVVEVANNYEKQLEIVNNYDESCLVVIISNYGNYFNYYNDIYNKLVAKRIPIILITQNYTSMKQFDFEETIYLTSKRYPRIGNYPLRIFSEYIIRRFAYLDL